MKKLYHFPITVFILASIFLVSVTYADNNTVYGWELMSEQERVEHRKKMQSFSTEEERNRYREEHHKQMQMRAKKKGVTLHDMTKSRINDRNKNMGYEGKGGSGRGR